MTVAVLNPQDCLMKGYRLAKQPLLSPVKESRTNPNFHNHRSNRTKRSPAKSRKSNNQVSSRAGGDTQKSPVKNNLVMGKVKILKRGEELAVLASKPVVEELTVLTPKPSVDELTVLAPKPAVTEPEKNKSSTESTPVKKRPDLDLCSTDRLGPDPESVQVHIRISESRNATAPNFYAGSAFFTSPPPSSLPLPAFFNKKTDVAAVNNDATDTLIKMLNLKLDRKNF